MNGQIKNVIINWIFCPGCVPGILMVRPLPSRQETGRLFFGKSNQLKRKALAATAEAEGVGKEQIRIMRLTNYNTENG